MSWFEKVPKVELHLHLEGAIPYDALWELICKYGGDSTVPDFEALKRKFEYKDFSHFIETWVWKNQFLREYQDFTFIAEAVAKHLANQNIRYAETFFSPGDYKRIGLKTQLVAEAIRTGLSRVKEIEVALVADLVRDFGPEMGDVTLEEVNEVKEFGIVGIGIGGSEQEFPPDQFEKVFEKARRFGFKTSAHAGEASGTESIWGAVRNLRVDRIGHGTRAKEDESLVNYLAEHNIPLEMCPLSNVRTGIIKILQEHPVRRYFERGLIVTINTDDPMMFGNSLSKEYKMLEERLGFSKDEIRLLILQGIRVSWMSEERKLQLIEEFQKDSSW
jgi:adenosine deaminase